MGGVQEPVVGGTRCDWRRRGAALARPLTKPSASALGLGLSAFATLAPTHALAQVDFVQPSHDKQDFERTDAMMRLEAKLKLLAPSYWKEHGRRVGYQAANPLPKTERELQAEAAANRAALEEEEEEVPGRLAASRLFGGRTEGARKRKIACHLQDYHIYHSAGPQGAADTRAMGAVAAENGGRLGTDGEGVEGGEGGSGPRAPGDAAGASSSSVEAPFVEVVEMEALQAAGPNPAVLMP